MVYESFMLCDLVLQSLQRRIFRNHGEKPPDVPLFFGLIQNCSDLEEVTLENSLNSVSNL